MPKCKYCGSTVNVEYRPNPYLLEIRGDNTKYYICDKCRHDLYMDI